MRRLDRRVRAPAVDRFVETRVERVDGVGALRVCVDVRVIPRALAQIAVIVDLRPILAPVVRTEDAAVLGFDERPEALRIGGGNGRAGPPARPALRPPGGARSLPPRVAAGPPLVEAPRRGARLRGRGGCRWAGRGRRRGRSNSTGPCSNPPRPLYST